MSSLENVDMLIGEALECLDEAAGEIKKLDIISQKEALMRIGRSLSELWEVRETLYKIKPEIRGEFVKEHSEDKQRYEDLSLILKNASEAEKNGEIEPAKSSYRELLNISKFGYFKLLAEAGLYRLNNQSPIEET